MLSQAFLTEILWTQMKNPVLRHYHLEEDDLIQRGVEPKDINIVIQFVKESGETKLDCIRFAYCLI